MKFYVTGSLLLFIFLYSCSTRRNTGDEQIERIAVAVRASPVFAQSDLHDFKKLDTLFITANELPQYRRLLDDMQVYDSLLKDAERIRDANPLKKDSVGEHAKTSIEEFIETVRSDKENSKEELTNLIDNATDTIYKIECTESLKNSSNIMSPTQATVYVNSHFKVIDCKHW
jgi:hypothetical protein